MFIQEPGVESASVLPVMEMTLNDLTDGDAIDPQDFLDRADILGGTLDEDFVSARRDLHIEFILQHAKVLVAISEERLRAFVVQS